MTGDGYRRIKLFALMGPTGAGKSDLALSLALETGGEIIVADSMQVYRYLDVGTAKATLDERRRVPHHLIDIVNPDEEFNAGLFRLHARPAIARIAGPIYIVGGTGLYIKALEGGLFPCPPGDRALRMELLEEGGRLGTEELHRRLKGVDPDRAGELSPNDLKRIVRALEVHELTGRPMSAHLREHRFKEREYLITKIGLFMERDRLCRRIEERTGAMLRAGLIEEVERVLAMGYSPDIKPLTSMTYKHVAVYIKGRVDREAMVSLINRDTRRYAKRQMTWLRADKEVVWVETDSRNLRDRLFRIVREFHQAGGP